MFGAAYCCPAKITASLLTMQKRWLCFFLPHFATVAYPTHTPNLIMTLQHSRRQCMHYKVAVVKRRRCL